MSTHRIRGFALVLSPWFPRLEVRRSRGPPALTSQACELAASLLVPIVDRIRYELEFDLRVGDSTPARPTEGDHATSPEPVTRLPLHAYVVILCLIAAEDVQRRPAGVAFGSVGNTGDCALRTAALPARLDAHADLRRCGQWSASNRVRTLGEPARSGIRPPSIGCRHLQQHAHPRAVRAFQGQRRVAESRRSHDPSGPHMEARVARQCALPAIRDGAPPPVLDGEANAPQPERLAHWPNASSLSWPSVPASAPGSQHPVAA